MLLVVIAGLSFCLWIGLWGFHSGFWRARERLQYTPAPATWPEVCAIIPARNEAAQIGPVISAHMASAYPGAFSVILADDQSDDGTSEIARAAAEQAGSPRALTIAAVPDLPPGWTGKLWAMRNGVAEARAAAPNAAYYLFTDADIAHAPATLATLVAKAERENLALVSLMARLDARGAWGALLIPAFIYFFQKLYPFPTVNDPLDPMAAAAGGCMLVRRDVFEQIGGVDPFRADLIDDCALARHIQRAGPLWLGLAENEVVSLRDNRSFSSVWKMVSRTAFTQLDHSWIKLAGTIAAMTLIYLVPPISVLTWPLHGNEIMAGMAGAMGLAAWLLMALTFGPTARLYDQPIWRWLLLPVAAAFYTLMTLGSALAHARGRGGSWKGRVY